MKKYEYRLVKLSYYTDVFLDFLNEYSLEGWEYVRTFQEMSEGEMHLLKRELPQDWAKESLEKVEEITEDQREEIKINPAEEQVKGMEEYIEQKRYSTALEEDQYALRKKQKQFGDISHQVLVASIYGEYDKVDHQALREESLKELKKGDVTTVIGVCDDDGNDAGVEVWMQLPEKYADAWRSLLDKKEG